MNKLFMMSPMILCKQCLVHRVLGERVQTKSVACNKSRQYFSHCSLCFGYD